MNILIYSDLHLEAGNKSTLLGLNKEKKDLFRAVDMLVLAGDIINLEYPEALAYFLDGWNKPVLYVAGNHEYYTNKPMSHSASVFKTYQTLHLPQLTWLQNEPFLTTIEEAPTFFGGTMWTDLNRGNPLDMWAAYKLNDYRFIRKAENQPLVPEDTIYFHEQYKEALIQYLKDNAQSKRVVISHHAPVEKKDTIFRGSPVTASFNSIDMVEIIEEYQPDLWIYGHTHESDDQYIGKTRIVSNPFGYYKYQQNPNFHEQFIINI
jgi:Icc-related predicted phosphoesterase